ncbi:MAG TPA: hypothetical protein VFT95_04050 [Micromonosporaceae bacterium]|nr:hypothetical protein [Micromonosporaceae bacterium]
MKLRPRLLAVAVAVASTAAVVTVTAPTASASIVPGPVVQAFHADSGDRCLAGVTDGSLGWALAAPPDYRVTVAVRGVVTDRPTPNDPRACPADPRYTMATFTAYAGRAEVDSEARRVDNGSLDFRFTLSVNSNLVTIDRVVVQVCRLSLLSDPFDYCGAPVEYRAPIRVTS